MAILRPARYTDPRHAPGESPLARPWARGLVVVSLSLLAACAAGPAWQTVPEAELRWTGAPARGLTISRVGGASRVIGAASEGALSLPEGRYVLEVDGLAIPVPMLTDAVRDGRGLDVELVATPAPLEGWVFIPGGPTLLGDVLGVGAADERPARIESIPSFWLGETEVTNRQYAAFLTDVARVEEAWIDFGGPKCRIQSGGDGIFVSDAPELPVVTVTHPGAVAYCDWRTAKTGVRHRLPTEWEWERAARGPESSTYSYGDVADPEAANQESGLLMPVRSFPATGWGTFDLTGNAFEWTSSEYDEGLMVLRGGSYVLDGPYLRNAFRMWYRPLVMADDIGFRVVREITR